MNKFLYWTPRTLAILYIFFLGVFSLDVFDEHLGPWETVLGLFLHNIPSIILAILLWVSWKREIVGGIIFNLVGLLYLAWAPQRFHGNALLVDLAAIAGPALLIGLLFTWGWFHKKKQKIS